MWVGKGLVRGHPTLAYVSMVVWVGKGSSHLAYVSMVVWVGKNMSSPLAWYREYGCVGW